MSDYDTDALRAAAEAELANEGLDSLAIEISMHLMDALAGAAMDAARTKQAADSGDAEASTLTAIHYGRVAGIMEAFAVLGLPCPIGMPSEAIQAAEFALLDPDGMKAFIAEGVNDILAEQAEAQDNQ